MKVRVYWHTGTSPNGRRICLRRIGHPVICIWAFPLFILVTR